MRIWWESLTLLQRIFAAVAIPATLLLVVQLVLTLIGLGDHDSDLDTDGDGVPDDLDLDMDGDSIPDGIDLDGDGIPDVAVADLDHDGAPEGDHGSLSDGLAGLRLFTFRGITAFLAVWGWAVLAITRAGRPWLAGVLIGLVMGVAAMVLIALTMQMILRLQADGTVSLANAVGAGGEVYLSVPALRAGEGKVNVVIQDTMTECAAVTDEESAIPTGTPVTVIGVTKDRQLIVMSR
jgi:hypothetical protein